MIWLGLLAYALAVFCIMSIFIVGARSDTPHNVGDQRPDCGRFKTPANTDSSFHIDGPSA